MDNPLSGVRVIEIGDRIATAYCGKLLRDAGADVVMLEHPDGHRLRRYSPAGTPAAADSPFFAFLAGGKGSVVVPGSVSVDLLGAADIVILGATPAQAAALGLGDEEIASIAASSTLVTISDFGWTGPWTEHPATEFTLQAWSGGIVGLGRGAPDRPPVSIGGQIGEWLTGTYAAIGTMISLGAAASRGTSSEDPVRVADGGGGPERMSTA